MYDRWITIAPMTVLARVAIRKAGFFGACGKIEQQNGSALIRAGPPRAIRAVAAQCGRLRGSITRE
jgi:hypothetical protein